MASKALLATAVGLKREYELNPAAGAKTWRRIALQDDNLKHPANMKICSIPAILLLMFQ